MELEYLLSVYLACLPSSVRYLAIWISVTGVQDQINHPLGQTHIPLTAGSIFHKDILLNKVFNDCVLLEDISDGEWHCRRSLQQIHRDVYKPLSDTSCILQYRINVATKLISNLKAILLKLYDFRCVKSLQTKGGEPQHAIFIGGGVHRTPDSLSISLVVVFSNSD